MSPTSVDTRPILRNTILLFILGLITISSVFAQSSTPAEASEDVKGGLFVKMAAKTTGAFSFEQRENGVYLVLDEKFKTKKAPDLKIYLTSMAISDVNSNNVRSEGSVFLSDLGSNKGAQEYLIPDEIDLSSINTVLIHCLKYEKLFGAGDIVKK